MYVVRAAAGWSLFIAGLAHALAAPAWAAAAAGRHELAAPSVCQNCAHCCVRPQDSIWLVSIRGLGCDAVSRYPAAPVYRYTCAGGWRPAPREEMLAAADPAVSTAIWIHGNRISSGMAFGVGLDVYRSLIRQACSEQPLQFIIFSWPSERATKKHLQDIRIKAARTNVAGYYLARLIDELPADVHTTLIGYSYGARIATGALHILGGGNVGPYSLPERVHAVRQPSSMVLIAAALDNDWLLPGRRHALALSQTDRMLNMINSCDRILMRYHLLYGKRCPQEALGYTGLVGGYQLGAELEKIEETDACCFVGPEHNWELYFQSPTLVGRMAPYVFERPQIISNTPPANEPTPAAPRK